jgi:hypothetical protein
MFHAIVYKISWNQKFFLFFISTFYDWHPLSSCNGHIMSFFKLKPFFNFSYWGHRTMLINPIMLMIMPKRTLEWITEVSAQKDGACCRFSLRFCPSLCKQRNQQNMEQHASVCCWQHITISAGVPTNTLSTKLCLNHVMLLTSHRVMLRGRNFEWITSCKSSSLLFKAFIVYNTHPPDSFTCVHYKRTVSLCIMSQWQLPLCAYPAIVTRRTDL